MDDELKPCPFCGHKAKHWMILEDKVWHIVECNYCHAKTDKRASQKSAEKAWNKRKGEEKQ